MHVGAKKHLCTVHTCICTGACPGYLYAYTPTTNKYRYTLHPPQTNADTPAHARLCNGALTALPMQPTWKLLRTILSLVQVQAVGFCTPTCCPGVLGPTTALSKKQSKSTLAHDEVAAALWSRSPCLATGRTSSSSCMKKIIPRIIVHVHCVRATSSACSL